MTLEELMIIAEEDKPKKLPPKKYKLIAYMERCLRGIIDGKETDDWSQVEEFIWENCQAGHTCEIINTETGIRKYAYPDSFNEDTVGVDELISDLLMEQKEQM